MSGREPTSPRRTTALLIPCPWSGDENDRVPRTYPVWFWLYATTRRLRHHLGLHDYQYVPVHGGSRCTWCGKGKQRRTQP